MEFWLVCEKYVESFASSKNQQEIIKLAEDIYEKFVAPFSSNEVNNFTWIVSISLIEPNSSQLVRMN